ncbi:MAG: UMP kinase [Patescibacteria group bacterium]|nr:UMP kinase [Patescibacteria group bacterium]MDD4304864.1 UMP kinase [Patescibacteria group bacterium]MDD4695836.1 UMP kinase [Patescibacteria group bacterium]
MKYKKVIIKLSGETLSSSDGFGFDFKKIKEVGEEIKKVYKSKTRVAIVIGAGNIFRARMIKNNELSRVESDNMGMIATVLNSICLSGYLTKIGVQNNIFSNVEISGIVDAYSNKKALDVWENGNVLIFAGGTGNPFFTTDTSAILKSLELGADIVIKTTQVDGVYDKDPEKYKDAKKFSKLSYKDALLNSIAIMDMTAFALAMDNKVLIRVIKFEKDNLIKVINGANIGTLVN